MKKIFLVCLIFIIGLFLLNFKVEFYTKKDRQIHYNCLAKGDTNGTLINPNKINLVKETDYGLFMEVWKVIEYR